MLPKPRKTKRKDETKRVFKADVMLAENLKSYVQAVMNFKIVESFLRIFATMFTGMCRPKNEGV